MAIKSRVKKIEEKIKEKEPDAEEVDTVNKFFELARKGEHIPDEVIKKAFRRKTLVEWLKEVPDDEK